MITRRHFLHGLAATAAASTLTPAIAETGPAITRVIPATGEHLPVVGMGSSRTFDTELTSGLREQLSQVLGLFFEGGGTLIDSSPMYGRAESVLGELLVNTPGRERLFAATKVWTDGRHQGIEQMQRSMQRMGVERFDLMQIHNLRDWQLHLETLLDWKATGRIRLVGVTTSHGRFHDDLESLLQQHPFDFVQLSYSLGNRDVERRLLPLARERGIAVIANRPFQRGSLFRRVEGQPLPGFAGELGITSWARFFLKYVVSHPAVTCTIPATSRPRHMRDNMGAGFGELPDAATRVRMERALESL
jgi:diketogulonate reductase-like aldo/keto reductase